MTNIQMLQPIELFVLTETARVMAYCVTRCNDEPAHMQVWSRGQAWAGQLCYCGDWQGWKIQDPNTYDVGDTYILRPPHRGLFVREFLKYKVG